MKLIFVFLIFFNIYLYSSDTFYYKNGQKISLEPIDSSSNKSSNLRSTINSLDLDTKYYKTPNDAVLGVRDDILVEIKKGYDISNYLSKYNLKIKKRITYYLYVLEKNVKEDSTIDIANQLFYEKGVKVANPNFIKSVKRR